MRDNLEEKIDAVIKEDIELSLVEVKSIPRQITFAQAVKIIVKAAVPFTAARITLVLGDYGNAVMIGKLGRQALAASSLINSVQAVTISVNASVLYATGILVGKAQAIQDYEEAGLILRQSWLLSVLLSIPAISFAIFSEKLLLLTGQPEGPAALVQDYFQAYSFGIPCEIILVSTQQFMLAIDKPKIVFYTSLANALSTLAFAYPFIFGKAGFPKMEMAGLGYASSLSAVVTLGGFIAYLKIHQDFKPYKIFSCQISKSLSIRVLKNLLKLGFFIGLQAGAEVTNILVTTMFIGWLGEDALAAQQVVGQYQYVFVVPLVMTAQVMGVLISQIDKKKSGYDISRLAYSGIKMSLIYSAAIALILSVMPDILMMPFIDVDDPGSAEVVADARPLYRIYAANLLVTSIYSMTTGALRGLGDTKTAMGVSVLNSCVITLSIGYWMAFPGGLEIIGFFLANLIGSSVGAALLSFQLHRESVKLIESKVEAKARFREEDGAMVDEQRERQANKRSCPSLAQCCYRLFSFFSSAGRRAKNEKEPLLMTPTSDSSFTSS